MKAFLAIHNLNEIIHNFTKYYTDFYSFLAIGINISKVFKFKYIVIQLINMKKDT